MPLLVLSKLVRFYLPKNNQDIYGFLTTSWGIKVNKS